jgi:hypothetical protein
MKHPALLLIPLACLPFVPRVLAREMRQDPPEIELPADPGPARAGQVVSVSSTPIEHRRLLEEVGTWSAEVQVFMAPGMAPASSTGREVNRMVGAAWLVSDFTGSKLGQPFHGHGQFGFDAEREVALGTWIDSDSADLRVMEGTYDLQRRERTFRYDQLSAEGELEHFESTSRVLDAEHRTFDVVRIGEGHEKTPVMHINYVLEER